jgi:hypothetical protein
MADDAIRDALERSIVELPDELLTGVRGLRCGWRDAAALRRVIALKLETVEARPHNA